MLSIIIPSYKDNCLNKTIQSLLDKAEGEIEIIPVLDGHDQDVIKDARVHPIFIGKNAGLRNAINTGMRMARGEYLAKTDAHCMFAKGYDTAITKMKNNWLVTCPRYFLDTDNWSVMPDSPVVYEKLIIDPIRNKFSGVRWKSRTKKRINKQIDETMMMQGSFWATSRVWWDTIGEMNESEYGRFTQEPVELTFKTWQLGGKLMVNKQTWYAHKHRNFSRTHQVSKQESDTGFTLALDRWKDFYTSNVMPKWNV